MSHLNNVRLRHHKYLESFMLSFQLGYMILEMSSVSKLGSRTTGNIAVHREKLDKQIFSNMISKYRNFSSHNYYFISRFFAWPHFFSFG